MDDFTLFLVRPVPLIVVAPSVWNGRGDCGCCPSFRADLDRAAVFESLDRAFQYANARQAAGQPMFLHLAMLYRDDVEHALRATRALDLDPWPVTGDDLDPDQSVVWRLQPAAGYDQPASYHVHLHDVAFWSLPLSTAGIPWTVTPQVVDAASDEREDAEMNLRTTFALGGYAAPTIVSR